MKSKKEISERIKEYRKECVNHEEAWLNTTKSDEFIIARNHLHIANDYITKIDELVWVLEYEPQCSKAHDPPTPTGLSAERRQGRARRG